MQDRADVQGLMHRKTWKMLDSLRTQDGRQRQNKAVMD